MKSPLHLGEATNAARTKYATAMLSCKEATTAMAQELKQPVYVKPNLTAENGKPFQGDLESIYTVCR
ncbi:hypothetical protein NXW48_01395 [Phocaeicola vulgatus]|nr:hypothetical protein [Phocaeicola vulgatus]